MTAGLILVEKNEASEFITTGPTPNFEQITNALVKNVAASSRRVYRIDAADFARWLVEHELLIEAIGFEEVSEYRAYLEDKYAKTTAARKLVVARRLLEVAVILKLRPDNPAEQVKGFKAVGENETPHTALTVKEARELLGVINIGTIRGKRDYALLTLLIRTGLRRAEAASLTLGDLTTVQGHNIAIIRHGKGDKRRQVKLPVDVYRCLIDYLETAGRAEAGGAAPLFVRVLKGDYPTEQPLTGFGIQKIVEEYAQAAGIKQLTPHGLRATFVTLALEGGAKLEQVQYAAGHADPRTTERYQRRKLNLDNNAVDYVKL